MYIHHLYMDHNKSFSRPKILHNHCFQFLPGITVVPKEIEDNGYAEFWGLRKVHYCIIVNVKMVNCHFFYFFCSLILLSILINLKKQVYVIKWRREKLTNIFTRFSSVQILKAPEMINIWTILGDSVNWVRKNEKRFQELAREPLGCYS